jgi:hypothetical protein
MPKSLEEPQSLAKRVRREIIVMIGAAKTGLDGLQHCGCGKKIDGPQALMRGARGAPLRNFPTRRRRKTRSGLTEADGPVRRWRAG